MGIINSVNNLPWFTIQLVRTAEKVKPNGVSVSFEVLVGLENLQVTLNNSKKNNGKITVSIQIMTSDNVGSLPVDIHSAEKGVCATTQEWIDYERIKLKKIADNDNGIYKYRKTALLTKPSQKINAYVTCEEAGKLPY
jgi:hypothetical protein